MNYADTQSKLPYVYTAVPQTSTGPANGQWQFSRQVNNFQNYPSFTYTTLTPVIRDAGIIGSRKHYTAIVDIPDFDYKKHVTLAVTNSKIDLRSFTFEYSAVVIQP